MAYDTLILLTHNMEMRRGVWRPDIHGRLRAKGAAALYESGTKIIVTGGIWKGEGTPSLAAVYVKELEREKIPRTALILEEESLSTVENLEAAKRYLNGTQTGVVTNYWHVRKTEYLMREQGIEGSVLGAEAFLDSHYNQVIARYKRSPDVLRRKIRQVISHTLLHSSLGKELLRRIRKVERH